MAEAFLPFSEIPDTEPETNFATLEQVHLKLSRPTKKSKYFKISLFYYISRTLYFISIIFQEQ